MISLKSRNAIRIAKVITFLILLLFCLELSFIIYPPLFVLGLGVIGRSPLCSSLQAFKGAERYQSFRKNGRITKRSRLIEKDPAGYHLWETPRGRYWIPEGSDEVLLILLAQQEARIYGMDIQTAVGSGDIVLDCGAHVGTYIWEALSSGAKLVVAIEPAQENLECLRRNFASEIAAGRVIVYPKGVWDKEDFLTLYTYPRNSAADGFVIFNPAAAVAKQMAPLTTIDRLVTELKLERVDFIKMDIKGSGLKALAGARNTLARYKPRLAISVEEEPEAPWQIAAAIISLSLGYQTRCGTCSVRDYYVSPNELLFFQ